MVTKLGQEESPSFTPSFAFNKPRGLNGEQQKYTCPHESYILVEETINQSIHNIKLWGQEGTSL